MWGLGNMRYRRTAVEAKVRDERGAAMAEYVPILAVIAAVVFFSFSFLGPWIGTQLGGGALSIRYGDDVVGECPTDWTLIDQGTTKKNGQNVNANSDSKVCLKNIPGGGNGNTNNNTNVKDNNSYPWEDG